jgi:hypothetical protein
MVESKATDFPTREWDADRFADVQFTHRVPAAKWGYFTQRVRPLADATADTLWAALFAGVGRPFQPRFARGWMGQFFQRGRRGHRGQGSDLKPGELFEEGVSARLGWEPSAAAFLAFQPGQVYVAPWSVWLYCFRRAWVPVDTSILCSESSSRVAVFWEGFGPYFADRGDRRLSPLDPMPGDTPA